MGQLQHYYEVYIRASAGQVWKALTDPEFTERYFYKTRVESDFRPGSGIAYRTTNGSGDRAIVGEIIEVEEPTRLVHSFDFENGDPVSRVVYELKDLGKVCKLTLTHDGFESETKTFLGVGTGWNPVLSGLKTLLETGESLEIPMPGSAD
jgi:uncharacterized protein YndB with AHSA1/START domain